MIRDFWSILCVLPPWLSKFYLNGLLGLLQVFSFEIAHAKYSLIVRHSNPTALAVHVERDKVGHIISSVHLR